MNEPNEEKKYISRILIPNSNQDEDEEEDEDEN